MPTLSILPFEDRHATAFRDLNLAWIEAYFTVEDEDRRLLETPRTSILEPGGHILMAELDGRAVGTCALLPIEPGHFELAKMCAAEDVRGHGIGRALLEATIEHAHQHRIERLTLLSSRKLTRAIELYRKLGFVEIDNPPGAEHYTRCDIGMQLVLNR